jgi:hypothetical protein
LIRDYVSLEASEYFPWDSPSGRLWPLIPDDLHLLTLPPCSIRGSRSWHWEWHRVKMSMTQIQWDGRVETSVLRTSRAGQGWWPNPVKTATWETETGRMVVWGELEQNSSESPSQPVTRTWWSVPVIPIKRAYWIMSNDRGPSRCDALSSNVSSAPSAPPKRNVCYRFVKHTVGRIDRGHWHKIQVQSHHLWKRQWCLGAKALNEATWPLDKLGADPSINIDENQGGTNRGHSRHAGCWVTLPRQDSEYTRKFQSIFPKQIRKDQKKIHSK